jgi:hypothetical protein
MYLQPNRNYKSNDDVMTPPELAEKIIKYFNPHGKLLEPCKGTGNFLRYMPDAEWCEIKEGKDFMNYEGNVDWIITNPPWSKMRAFLTKSLDIAENIVFLITINHLWTKARVRAIYSKGYHIAEIIALPEQENFPNSGFQLGVIHIKKGNCDMIKFKLDYLEKIDISSL